MVPVVVMSFFFFAVIISIMFVVYEFSLGLKNMTKI